MEVKSVDQLTEILGTPRPVLEKKIYSSLNPNMVRFIAHSPLVFMSTVGEDGCPTVSPKGDSPGFIKVPDASHLLIPERKGNKLAYSLRNILAGSKVALLFVVPGTSEVLRVHGTASILNDPALNAKLASDTHDAILVTRLHVTNCYFHCGKALLRSKLFSGELKLMDMEISFGEELSGNNAFSADEADVFDQGVKERYKTDL